MKRFVLFFVMAYGTLCSYAQEDNFADYSLEGLSKACLNCTEVSSFSNGLARVEVGEKVGLIDKMGNYVVPIGKFDKIFVYEFSTKGTATVIKGKMFGKIDNKGNLVTPFHKIPDDGILSAESVPHNRYTDKGQLRDFSDGLAVILKNNKFGYIDENGRTVIPPKYADARDFHEGLAAVTFDHDYENKHWGFINKLGEVVIPFIYSSCGDFSEGLVCLAKDCDGECEYSFYNKSGEKAFPASFYSCGDFKDGMASVMNEDRLFGFINHSGEMVTPYIYNHVEKYFEGLALVWKDGKGGYINRFGEMVTPCIYDHVEKYSEGLAAVRKGDKWGYVDKNGKCSLDY